MNHLHLMNRVVSGCWLVAIVAIACPRMATGQPSVSPAKEVRIDQELDVQVPLDLTFNDESGQPVRLGELIEGKPVILNLVYYRCPMLCNLAMDGLVTSLRSLSFDAGDQFTVITVSFDSREEPRLAAAAKRTAIKRYGRPESESHWHFLTGRQEAIRRLTDAVGFHYKYDSTSGQYAHAAALIVLTPQGRVSRYLMGVEYPARDLRLSLVEASDNRIGSLTDQVLLLCYHYDPRTGKYGLLIQNVMRVAGVFTVLMIGGSVGAMLYFERRKKRLGKSQPGKGTEQ